jgi:hypothetical protein
MPQLDFYSIANQLVFGSLSFIFFYLTIELYVVPTLFTSIFARDYYLKNSRNNVNTLFYYSFFAFYIFSRLVEETHTVVSSSENNLNYLASLDKRIFSKNFQKDDFADIIKVMASDAAGVICEYDSNFEMEPVEAPKFSDIEVSNLEQENSVIINGKPFRFKFLFTNIEDKVPSIELLNTPGDSTNITDFDLQEFQKLILDDQMEGAVTLEDSSAENDELAFDLEPRPSKFSEETEAYSREFLVKYLKDKHDTYDQIYSSSKTINEVQEYRELMEEEEEGEEEGQEEDEDLDEEESDESSDEDNVEDFSDYNNDRYFSDADSDDSDDDTSFYEDYQDLVYFLREEEKELFNISFHLRLFFKLIK